MPPWAAAIRSAATVLRGLRSGANASRYGEFSVLFGNNQADTSRDQTYGAQWTLDLSASYAYTDSASDLPMLEAVGHPVAVNPDAKLERHARRNGWPIVIFSEQTKSVVRRTVRSVGAVGIAGASFAAGVALSSSRSGKHRSIFRR